ncbi:hypothetical protein K438DRAFT_1854272 [Mycena galopus ATCC 62051]|nr:hypothetical protein K438DRAFT_1854272 [Mycena galopus ATCC 62051]
MAPKGHRAAPAPPRHSRSTSATKLLPNLQFTQKKVLPRPKQPPQHAKQRAGFHIASPGDEEEEEEEDWVSSESGAVTPNPHNEDDSDLESPESDLNVPAAPTRAELPRVATARPSDYKVDPPRPQTQQPDQRRATTTTQQPEQRRPTPAPQIAPPPTSAPPARTADKPRVETSRTTDKPRIETRVETRETRTETRNGNGNGGNRYSESPTPITPTRRRPMSSHSMNKPELRLHPLIRGQSFGQPSPKPTPLLPVAVTADVAQLTTSPSTSPTSPYVPHLARRTSVSSARSVATVATTHPNPPPRSVRESRHRTFSALSAAPSSAALSSLTHLPAVSRPPSPQMIAFFPPANPHVRADDIHPLLPPPYVTNHLTVLARRTPIREAFERVVRARQQSVRV